MLHNCICHQLYSVQCIGGQNAHLFLINFTFYPAAYTVGLIRNEVLRYILFEATNLNLGPNSNRMNFIYVFSANFLRLLIWTEENVVN